MLNEKRHNVQILQRSPCNVTFVLKHQTVQNGAGREKVSFRPVIGWMKVSCSA